MPRHRRAIPEINAGSMADIAFLLLIFFLVTTSIIDEKGLTIKLPPIPKQQQAPPSVLQRNVFDIQLKENNQIMVQGEMVSVQSLSNQLMAFIDNTNRNPNYSESPRSAVVILKTDPKASYGAYIDLQNTLRSSYLVLRERYSLKTYNKHFNDLILGSPERQQVEQAYPIKISEAELVNP
jgi:biopolymer transport protein ExbD